MQLSEREYFMLQRKRKHIKLRQLAGYIGVSISMISQHELGKTNLSDHYYQKYKNYIEAGRK